MILATPIGTKMLRVKSLNRVEKTWVAEVDCLDYDHYKNLPDAIQIVMTDDWIMSLGKTGWNSDRCIACYQSTMPVPVHVPGTVVFQKKIPATPPVGPGRITK